MSKIRNMLFKLLPYELQKQLLRGRISQGADYFLFDYGLLELLKNESYSQHAQDAFIFNMIFGQKDEGVFLDIGANDPIKINNTYLFELHGWTGLAFEPIVSLANKWKDVRKTKCYNVAIGDQEGQVKFTENVNIYFSHVGDTPDDKNGINSTYMVSQVRLTDFLNTQGIKKVDVALLMLKHMK